MGQAVLPPEAWWGGQSGPRASWARGHVTPSPCTSHGLAHMCMSPLIPVGHLLDLGPTHSWGISSSAFSGESHSQVWGQDVGMSFGGPLWSYHTWQHSGLRTAARGGLRQAAARETVCSFTDVSVVLRRSRVRHRTPESTARLLPESVTQEESQGPFAQALGPDPVWSGPHGPSWGL